MELSYTGTYRSMGGDTILTETGDIYKKEDNEWSKVNTPDLFYYNDINTGKTFTINKNKKYIEEGSPSGKVFDLTDNFLYFVSKGKWNRLYKIHDEVFDTVIRCDVLPCDIFHVIGEPLEICKQSQINNVDLDTGMFIEPIYQSKVLTYLTRVGDEILKISHIFIKQKINPLVSLKGGKLIDGILKECDVIHDNTLIYDEDIIIKTPGIYRVNATLTTSSEGWFIISNGDIIASAFMVQGVGNINICTKLSGKITLRYVGDSDVTVIEEATNFSAEWIQD